MSNQWKKYFKDRYKKKSTNRALKSMAKMEKYKNLPYPNYTVPPMPALPPDLFSLPYLPTLPLTPMGVPYSPFIPFSGVPTAMGGAGILGVPPTMGAAGLIGMSPVAPMMSAM